MPSASVEPAALNEQASCWQLKVKSALGAWLTRVTWTDLVTLFVRPLLDVTVSVTG